MQDSHRQLKQNKGMKACSCILWSSLQRKRGPSPSIDDRSLPLNENMPDTQLGCAFEVFLNFCGGDTRQNFTDYLYRSLVKADVCTFKDDEDHSKGEKIEKILQAIEQSRISIPIFSKNYASREWCLRELVKMIECKETRNQMILPVFLDVKPQVVREQSDGYGKAFRNHLRKFNDVDIQNWRKALTKVSELNGWDLQEAFNRKQGELVDAIISEVQNILNKGKLTLPDPLIKMDEEEKQLMDLMSINANDVRIIGIHGKPRAGKSTLAKVIYNKFFYQYERCCFLEGISNKSQNQGQQYLQRQLMSKSLEGRDLEKIHLLDDGINLIHQGFRGRKVLVLLDNVDQKEQLDDFRKKPEWFGLGSRIIVTTRNKCILEAPQVYGSILCEVMKHQNSQPEILLNEIRDSNFNTDANKVLDLLAKREVSTVGIYGIGGVGKTTLAMKVHDCLLNGQNALSEVFWVTVSQDCSIYNLQSKIAKQIGTDLSSDDDEKIRAGKLSKAFQKKGMFALFLDDAWSPFSLEDFGFSRALKEYKLILTTRLLDVCRQMHCNEESIIEVGSLSDDEAWKLFKEKIGQEVMLPLEIDCLGRKITKKCAGLPLAIVTMAGSLRGEKDVHEWRDTLKKLNQSKQGHEGMDYRVIPILQLSYDRLKDSTMQQCFCYSALFPEDEEVERNRLINLFIDVGVIDEGSWEDDFDKGHTILNKLERASLLIGIERGGLKFVKMHDLIRDMALRITRSKFMVKSGQSLRKLQEAKEGSGDLEVVSMMRCGLKEIIASPKCPKMSALLLSNNRFCKIPNYFFEHMYGLKVLDISGNRDIGELPDSVANLVKLTALILDWCPRLKWIPSLAKLSALRRLGISFTALEELPDGIENLVNLRDLSLRRHHPKKVPIGILPKLSSLRSLEIDWPKGIMEALPKEELASLQKLEYFYCSFADWKSYKAFTTSFLKAHTYTIILSEYKGLWPKKDICRHVRIDLCCVPKKELIMLPKDTESLYLMGDYDGTKGLEEEQPMTQKIQSSQTFYLLKALSISGCHYLKKLLEPSWLSNLQNLESLAVHWCEGVQEIVATSESGAYSSLTLPKLRYLQLTYLPAVERISEGMLVCDSLQEIMIILCQRIKRIPVALKCVNGRLSPPSSLLNIKIDQGSFEESEKYWRLLQWDDPDAVRVLQHLVRYVHNGRWTS